MKNNKTIRADIFTEITNNIIESLELNDDVWQMPWAFSLPIRSNDQYYQGINCLILSIKASKESHQFSKWLTFKQAKELGGNVKKGEKSTRIFYCSSIIIKDKEGNLQKEEEKEIFFRKQYAVFNISQIENLPAQFYQNEKTNINKSINKHHEIELLLSNHNVNLVNHDQASAFYNHKEDLINLPNISKFESNEAYYATLLHELSHWTGHKDRLNRNLEHYHNSKENRAKEELIAEIASMFLTSHFNIKASKENHISYLKSWVKILKEDKKAIFEASSKAQKIFNFLVNETSKN